MPTSQSVSFWNFIVRQLLRAGTETADLLELRMRTLIILGLCLILGVFMHFKIRGGVATKDEMAPRIILDLAPTAIIFTVIFLFNLVRAPYLMYSESQRESDAKVQELKNTINALKNAPYAFPGSTPQPQIVYRKDPADAAEIERLKGELKGQKDTQEKKIHDIQERLSEFLTEGRTLSDEWMKTMGTVAQLQQPGATKIQEWHKRIEDYIRTIPRGSIYLARFNSSGQTNSSYPSGINMSVAGVWDIFINDEKRLNEFIVDSQLGKN